MTTSAPSGPVRPPPRDARSRLFLVSCLALATTGVGASLRANTAGELQRIFFDPIDKAHSAEMIASVLGIAAQSSFRDVALLPSALLIVFGAIWLHDRSRARRADGIVAVGTRA